MGPERSGFRFGGRAALLLISVVPVSAYADPAAAPPAAPPLNLAAPPPADEELPPPAAPEPEEVTPPPSNVSPLVITGYVDVGFAKAQGNGTSWPAAWYVNTPALGGPADYYVDPFAPAINSRGEVASVAAPPGTTIGGFLPRSANIGGKPSFLINTADVDLRYTAPELPVMIFTRLQVLPRLYDAVPTPPTPDTSEGFPAGEYTRLFLEQAFGKINPLRNAELAISLGKFDSVFGIEYLDNEANFRVGVTPSLLARYTTGQSTGLKVFYRYQIIPASSAVSLNVAATNSGTFVEALQGPSRSLTGRPLASGRLGYELNLPRASIKLGASYENGPRNDQQLSPDIPETLYGFDLRVVLPTFVLSGEYVHIAEEDAGELGPAVTNPPKLAGTGAYPQITEFYAHGFWVQAAEELPLSIEGFRLTIYGRYEQRHAQFPDAAGSTLTVDRITGGANVGLGESLQLKAEYLVNRELSGAPQVPNNVFTSSAVWSW
ncbi:MAG TPA: hypothetical protein VKZ18_22645 [Polyangia bacterium]|nr:hypothetical protein [Polyangia bacterium]